MAVIVTDVAPALQQEIMTSLQQNIGQNKNVRRLVQSLAEGRATYYDAHLFSQIVGEQTSTVLLDVLNPAVLPDRRLYYNIADRTLKPAMEYANSIVSNYTETMQQYMNRRAGLNIKAIKPKQNKSTIENLCGMASDYEDFEDGRWILDKPVQTTAENVVDRFVRANAYFADAAGLEAVVVRTAEADCCPWCGDLEGSYPYAETRSRGADIYRRHNNCRCMTEYYPAKGNRAQDVWGKNWRSF